jgi:hypothetical protein
LIWGNWLNEHVENCPAIRGEPGISVVRQQKPLSGLPTTDVMNFMGDVLGILKNARLRKRRLPACLAHQVADGLETIFAARAREMNRNR